MTPDAGPWPTERCPACREPIIHAVLEHGEAVKLDAEPATGATYALTDRGPGMRPRAYKPKPSLAFGRPHRNRHPSPCIPAPPTGRILPARPGSTPALGQHRFDPYPTDGEPEDPGWLPPDPHTGKRICQTCKAPGVEGDQRHPADIGQTPLPVTDSARARAAAAFSARVLGERTDDDDTV